MAISEILATIDQEIAQLQQARALLSGAETDAPKRGKVGRPRKATTLASVKEAGVKKKRNLSPEGRKRIADAVKLRWAKQKKAE